MDKNHTKNAAQLLEEYANLVSPEKMDAVLSLFSEDGVLEFPYNKSIGIPDRFSGKEAIRKEVFPFIQQGTQNFRFHDIKVWASADPDRAFGEYTVTATVKSTGRVFNQTYVARCESKNGKIVHLVEYSNPLIGAIAILPNGLQDLIKK